MKLNTKINLRNYSVKGFILLIILVFGVRIIFSQVKIVSEDDSMLAEIDSLDYEKLKRQLEIDSISLIDYSAKVKLKARDLGDYMSSITDKRTDEDELEILINLALNLFKSDTCSVAVSKINVDEIKYYTIKEYLIKLKQLRGIYDKIEITWSKVAFVSNLKLGTDGRYHGVVSIEQKFKAYRDGRIVYTDVTQKNIEIILEGFKICEEGICKNHWQILLSQIGVVETRNI